MKKSFLVMLMVLAVASFALAQIQAPTSDVLGAHLNYGRGCAGLPRTTQRRMGQRRQQVQATRRQASRFCGARM